MGRGGKRRGGGGGGGGGRGRGRGKGRGGGRSGKTGIEKYGLSEADEFLKLDDDVFSDAGGSEDDGAEEDILTLKKGPAEEKKKTKKAKNKKKAEAAEQQADDEEAEEEDPERSGGMTKGWRKQDFYGGDDAGDASEADSDEDLVLEEARRLEELRAKRLKGEVDPLAALLGGSQPEEKKEAKEEAEQGAVAGAGSGAGAQFETLFAAEAERGSVQRDLKKLPEAKRRGLLKSEAPELVPLLTDFRAKLQGLRKIVPLLAPQAHEHMKPTGVSYLKAKATLLLNTLTNLSYYIMLRAEGGSVRSHPVISQLVWLRELHEMLAPLDERLDPALAKAMKDWKKLRKLSLESEKAQAAATASAEPKPPAKSAEPLAGAAQQQDESAKPAEPAKRLTLRERFQQLEAAAKAKAAAEAAAAAAKKTVDSKQSGKLSMSDLFKLPSKRRKDGGAADAPADLGEADPLIGGWQPTSTLAEQLLSVRQQLGERAAKTKAPSADLNVEAQPLKPRQRMRESQEEVDATAGRLSQSRGEDEPMSEAKTASKARKAKKAAAAEERRKALAAQQFKPEQVLEGRRATSQKILKNRGLVRQRKRSAGNARVNNRQKYEKAVKRRKGAVQEMREGAVDGTYDGEATGVRTHVKKSLKLG